MSAKLCMTLMCDGYKIRCLRTFSCGEKNAGPTRLEAAKSGWMASGTGKDFCWECKSRYEKALEEIRQKALEKSTKIEANF